MTQFWRVLKTFVIPRNSGGEDIVFEPGELIIFNKDSSEVCRMPPTQHTASFMPKDCIRVLEIEGFIEYFTSGQDGPRPWSEAICEDLG